MSVRIDESEMNVAYTRAVFCFPSFSTFSRRRSNSSGISHLDSFESVYRKV